MIQNIPPSDLKHVFVTNDHKFVTNQQKFVTNHHKFVTRHHKFLNQPLISASDIKKWASNYPAQAKIYFVSIYSTAYLNPKIFTCFSFLEPKTFKSP